MNAIESRHASANRNLVCSEEQTLTLMEVYSGVEEKHKPIDDIHAKYYRNFLCTPTPSLSRCQDYSH